MCSYKQVDITKYDLKFEYFQASIKYLIKFCNVPAKMGQHHIKVNIFDLEIIYI